MAQREPLAISQLVADHHQALYRYAYRLTGCVPDAEDLVQQVFLVAQQKLDQVRDANCVRGWLFAVLRNAYFKCHRKRLALPVTAEFDVHSVPQPPSETPIDSDELQAAINALSDDFKVVVLMFYFEHRPYREIADLLNVPIGTIMSRLARAKAQLRNLLAEADAMTVAAQVPSHQVVHSPAESPFVKSKTSRRSPLPR
jgi:RNA polymerase sigma-70 factor, ECF subfamily